MKLHNLRQALEISFLILSLFAPHSLASDTTASRPASEALKELKEGNERFRTHHAIHQHQDQKTREELSKGQKPHTIVLSCSDSRTSPEVVFDQGLGDLFVIRTAGHVIASPDIASIEYAVEHLGTRLIVVMGHESCGAVKAALTTPVGQSIGSPHLDSLVGSIQRDLKITHETRMPASVVEKDPLIREPVKIHAHAVAEELMERSKIVREFVEKHDLKIVNGIYGLKSGEVDFWNF